MGEAPDSQGGVEEMAGQIRQLRDPRAMRALAHPVRMALVEELAIARELTATQASQLIGESPANCSFHLRQLAKYGFVEESGSGQGRNRPWRLRIGGLDLGEDADEAPATGIARVTLATMFQERALERLRRWWSSQSAFSLRWRKAAQSNQSIWWVTVEELEELSEEISALTFRYYERIDDPSKRPPGAVPVEFLAHAYPLQMPPVSETGENADAEGEG